MSDKSNHHQVLFVDDNHDYLEAVGESFRLLSAEDWQLQAANSANQALQIIKSGGMDLVVLDVDFTDGDQFISLLHGCYPKLKIAVMTAEPTNEKRAASIAAGAGMFFEKPVSAEGIQSVFRQLCGLLHWEPSEGFQGGLRGLQLKDDFNAFAANDIEQGKRRAFGLLGAAFQLRDITHGHIEVAGKSGLAEMRPLPQRADFLAADRFGRCDRSFTQMTQGDLFMRCGVHDAKTAHIVGCLKNGGRQPAALLRHRQSALCG